MSEPRERRIHVFAGDDGDWRWHVIAGNGKKVAEGGEGYRNRTECVQEAIDVTAGQYEVVIDE